jgi:hypothetical protein
MERITPYERLNFNHLIDTLEIDGVLLIKAAILIKVQPCLSSFEDLRLSIEKLSASPENDWLKILLIEHIMGKFSLIFFSSKSNRKSSSYVNENQQETLIFI